MSMLLGPRKSAARYRASWSKGLSIPRTPPTTLLMPTLLTAPCHPSCWRGPQNCAGSAPPEPALAAHGSTTGWSRVTSSSPTCAGATTSILPTPPAPSPPPSPRRFNHYLPQKRWQRGPEMIDLPEKTVLIVGVGGAGGEASKLCAALGMHVLGIDPRGTERPAGMADLASPDRLEERLGAADFVILTTPETPDTLGMFNARLFSRMKRGAYFINIARGRCVVTQDLIAALQSGQLAGAGLDVADPEPLPA